ncbi:MAG: DNA polymerase III subunit delta [Bacteroidia bacterium]|nr:DNA polymerase III subunit delta [Bacteroidia bacterium]
MTEIDARQFRPVYFLEGEEPYFIDKIADRLEQTVLTEAEKGFNLQVVYGRDGNVVDLLSSARRFPMMSEYQLIIVREAQSLKGLDQVLDYLANPVKSTVLVFLHKNKKVSKATKLGRELKKYGVFTSNKLYERDVTPWMANHLKTLGLSIQPQAAQVLIQTFGSDLQKITGELDKARAGLGERKSIEMDDLARGGGIDKEYNVFELTKSIGKRDLRQSLRIVNYFAKNPKDNPFVLILINLFNYFKKVHLVHFQRSTDAATIAKAIGMSPYFVGEYLTASRNYQPAKMNQVFDVLHEFDLKSKGIGSGKATDSELLTELVVRLIK